MKKKIIELNDNDLFGVCAKSKGCCNCPLHPDNYNLLTQFGCIRGYRNMWKTFTLYKDDIDYLNIEVETNEIH